LEFRDFGISGSAKWCINPKLHFVSTVNGIGFWIFRDFGISALAKRCINPKLHFVSTVNGIGFWILEFGDFGI
jgi:hypothetical protein